MHSNGGNSYIFVNGTDIFRFKARDSEIVATPLCLGNISKDWSVDNMKQTGFNGFVYDFSVDYDDIIWWIRNLADKSVEECNENIDEAKSTEIALIKHKNKCACYYTVFNVLAVIALTVSIEIGACFVYYNCINDYVYQAKNY